MTPTPEITKYIDPFTDFGFKRLFGNEPNKDLLIDLLNSIFNGRKVIVALEYNKNEHHAETKEDGSAIFDLSCTGADGERFIIEVQRGTQLHFKKRAIYYTSILATELAPKGNRAGWGYNLPEIYFIALIEDFTTGEEGDNQYLRDICLIDRNNGKVFYDGLGYIFLELTNFVKQESELESDLDRWLYVLKNMSKLDKIPVFTRKPIFEKLFSIAEFVKLNKHEKHMYNAALKQKWDAQNKLEYAWEKGMKEGLEKGLEKGKLEGLEKGKLEGLAEGLKKGKQEERLKALNEKKQLAVELLKMGLQVAEIARLVGLTVEEIKQL
jgi:predicted transposase/invertase (TIGR01784 family)